VQTERGENPASLHLLHVALLPYRKAVADYMAKAVRNVDVGFGVF